MERYYVVIALTFIGFVALAAMLLVPVYLFLKREEDVASHWTDETVAQMPGSPTAVDEPSGAPEDEGVTAADPGSRSGGS